MIYNTLKPLLKKLPLHLIFAWFISLIIVYNLFIIERPDMYDSNNSMGSNSIILHTQIVDAVVLISMGVMASNSVVDYSIASIRKVGNWKGDIFVITDSPSCFYDTIQRYNIKTIPIEPIKNIIGIKALKTKLFNYVPNEVSGILYLDVDIVVTRDLSYFFKDIMYKLHHDISNKYRYNNKIDFGAFPDANGHYVGFCSGCEKWHTGVIWMRRNGESALSLATYGRFDTDQESLDAAELSGSCENAFLLPKRHLLFAKDYIATFFTTGQTFIHVTGVGRLVDQGWFYRKVIIPRIGINYEKNLDNKKCEISDYRSPQPSKENNAPSLSPVEQNNPNIKKDQETIPSSKTPAKKTPSSNSNDIKEEIIINQSTTSSNFFEYVFLIIILISGCKYYMNIKGLKNISEAYGYFVEFIGFPNPNPNF